MKRAGSPGKPTIDGVCDGRAGERDTANGVVAAASHRPDRETVTTRAVSVAERDILMHIPG